MLNNITKQIDKYNYLPFIYIAVVTLWTRFINLGYSDYQGDEIKALYTPEANQTLTQFLLDQRKGPVQFLITYILKLFDPLYIDRFFIRLPFAIASVLAVYFFYKFLTLHVRKKIAVYATAFFALNGLFIAFGRIVQYQSFVILFSILALYMFSLAVKSVKWRIAGLYLGMLFWSISMLAHYDGIFIAPVVAYLYLEWFKISSISLQKKLTHILLSGVLAGLFLLTFYLPFVLAVGDSQTSYWLDRLAGGEGKLSSSFITFKLYNPKLVTYIYIALTFIGLIKLSYQAYIYFYTKKYVAQGFRFFYIICLWAALPFLFMEVITAVPGTHIYTYVMPATIIVALGILVVENALIKLLGYTKGNLISLGGLTLTFVFMTALSNAIFIDNTSEWPYEPEEFMVWTINQPSAVYHLSLFGFPYYRGWDEIANYIHSSENTGYYSTNERTSMTSYHIDFKKDTDKSGHYIVIKNPQSLIQGATQKKSSYWTKHYPPVFQTFKCDKGSKFNYKLKTITQSDIVNCNKKAIADVYYMPTGSLDEIKEKGY